MEKKCRKCGQVKPRDAFAPRKAGLDGLNAQCRDCRNAVVRAYRSTDEGKANTNAASKRYRSKDEAKARRRLLERERYASDPAYRARVIENARRFAATECGKAAARRSRAKYVENNGDKVKARSVVNHAIESGKLPEPDSLDCAGCGRPADEYHHHKGYDAENWLNVVAVCKGCHEAIDHGRAMLQAVEGGEMLV
jgi:hypothetical protein